MENSSGVQLAYNGTDLNSVTKFETPKPETRQGYSMVLCTQGAPSIRKLQEEQQRLHLAALSLKTKDLEPATQASQIRVPASGVRFRAQSLGHTSLIGAAGAAGVWSLRFRFWGRV